MIEYLKKEKVKYVLLGFLSWFLVDWATAGGCRLSYFKVPFIGHFLRLIIFLGSPLFLAYLIFDRQYNNKELFLAMLVNLVVVEILITRNSLLYTFPGCMVFIPVAVAIYSLVVFLPLWIIKKKVQKNRGMIFFLSLVLIIVLILISLWRGAKISMP